MKFTRYHRLDLFWPVGAGRWCNDHLQGRSFCMITSPSICPPIKLQSGGVVAVEVCLTGHRAYEVAGSRRIETRDPTSRFRPAGAACEHASNKRGFLPIVGCICSSIASSNKVQLPRVRVFSVALTDTPRAPWNLESALPCHVKFESGRITSIRRCSRLFLSRKLWTRAVEVAPKVPPPIFESGWRTLRSRKTLLGYIWEYLWACRLVKGFENRSVIFFDW